MKILVVKLSAFGDIVHAFPTVEEARERVPDIEIDWLADSRHVALVRHFAGVSRVLTPDTPDRREYDLIIDAQGLLRSAWAARAHGNRIVGTAGTHVREWPSHWLYRQKVSFPPALHAVDEIRLLLGAALGYPVQPGTRAQGNLARRRKSEDRRSVLLFHGTAQRCKLWPEARWIDLARRLVARELVPVVVGLGEEETAFCRRLVATVPGLRFEARSDMPTLERLIDEALFCVTVDTGLGHLADWCGCPTLMLFQASDPVRFRPYFASGRAIWAGPQPTRLKRRDRNRECRHDMVTPDMVIDALAGWWP
jgi:heptosyltransferase-1